MKARTSLLAAQLVMLVNAGDGDEDPETGKIVAWVITCVICIVLLAMIISYCICSRIISRPQDK